MKKLRPIIVLIVFIVFVVGVFYVFSNKEEEDEETIVAEVTKMETLLAKNMNISYPPTPREVVKYYSDLSVELYKGSYSEEYYHKIADRFLELYDLELVNEQNQYFDSFLKSVQDFKAQGITISEYSISSSVDVETFSEDGFEWARLYVTYRLRQELKGNVSYQNVEQVFLLRKDEENHYKIYGFGEAGSH